MRIKPWGVSFNDWRSRDSLPKSLHGSRIQVYFLVTVISIQKPKTIVNINLTKFHHRLFVRYSQIVKKSLPVTQGGHWRREPPLIAYHFDHMIQQKSTSSHILRCQHCKSLCYLHPFSLLNGSLSLVLHNKRCDAQLPSVSTSITIFLRMTHLPRKKHKENHRQEWVSFTLTGVLNRVPQC